MPLEAEGTLLFRHPSLGTVKVDNTNVTLALEWQTLEDREVFVQCRGLVREREVESNVTLSQTDGLVGISYGRLDSGTLEVFSFPSHGSGLDTMTVRF